MPKRKRKPVPEPEPEPDYARIGDRPVGLTVAAARQLLIDEGFAVHTEPPDGDSALVAFRPWFGVAHTNAHHGIQVEFAGGVAVSVSEWYLVGA